MDAAHQYIEDSVDDFTHIDTPMPTSAFFGRNQILGNNPLTVCKIGWVWFSVHIPNLTDLADNQVELLKQLLRVKVIENDETEEELPGEVIKFGEWPPFGPPVPRRVLKLFEDSDRGLFLKGRRAENQGMGIGAFTYYRRVIESQKDRLIEQIIKAAIALESPKEMIELLQAAKAEDQFSRAIEHIKDVFPESLKVKGHNPLTIIHNALSGGIHGLSDKECLQRATNIRILLTGLAERMDQALKNETELKEAVKNLLPPPTTKKTN